MKLATLVSGGLAILSIGCARENVMETRLRTRAPASAQDVGVVLEGAKQSEVESLLDKNPQAQVRVLNKDHGMYEVFGVSQSEAQSATKGQANDNVYFELQRQPRHLGAFSVAAPVGLQIGNLNACRAANGSPLPEAKLAALTPADLIDGSTIDLGTAVSVRGIGGKSNMVGSTQGQGLQALKAPTGSGLKSVIVIMAPEASANPQTVLNVSSTQFTVDTLGVYQVFLIVQDASDVCAMDAIRFVVTANRPYNGPNAPDLKIDLTKMSHLQAVSAQAAWQISQGDGVTIAVIDTGVDYNHPALAPNIQLNTKEIADNQKDDDGNGFVDDVLGYDFVNSDAYPYDDDSHGTHVSGLAAAKQFGLARKAKILPIKALTGIGGDVATIAAAMRYAVDRGARVINMSLGGAAPQAHPALVSAAAYAEKNGALLVVAAGNGDPQTGLGFDIDKQPTFPASLTNENLIAVAAFDGNNPLTTYSNFGKTSVDVVAPGGGQGDLLISAYYENPKNQLFTSMAGTSMATPVVSGIAADVIALNPQLTPKEVKQILIGAGPQIPELRNLTVSGRHLDALAALQAVSARSVLF